MVKVSAGKNDKPVKVTDEGIMKKFIRRYGKGGKKQDEIKFRQVIRIGCRLELK